jgi:hypothetical protein
VSVFIFSRCTALMPRELKNNVTYDPSRSRESAVIRALNTCHSPSWKHITDTFFLTALMDVPLG